MQHRLHYQHNQQMGVQTPKSPTRHAPQQHCRTHDPHLQRTPDCHTGRSGPTIPNASLGPPTEPSRNHGQPLTNIKARSYQISVRIPQRPIQLRCNTNGTAGMQNNCSRQRSNPQIMGFPRHRRLLRWASNETLPMLHYRPQQHPSNSCLRHSHLSPPHTDATGIINRRSYHPLSTCPHSSYPS